MAEKETKENLLQRLLNYVLSFRYGSTEEEMDKEVRPLRSAVKYNRRLQAELDEIDRQTKKSEKWV